tara:strand:+ start:330 stop:1952 length:1623 start_codon:yes stop_codon:yes gene_type:complete
MGSPITVYRPRSNVIRLGGGNSTSVAGSPGGGGSGGVGDIFNFFKGLAQDRDNKLILENHGMDREAVDLLSAEDRSALVTSVSANDVKRDEQRQTGENVQSGVDIFAKLSEANKKLDQDRNIPLELQFGRGINSKDPTSNETGGEQIPNKSPEEFTTNDDGSVNLNELNVNASRDIPDSRSTVEFGKEGEAFPPKSGTELLTDLFRSKESASLEQIDRREQAGASFMKPSQIVEAEKGNLMARLTGQAGNETTTTASVNGKNYQFTRDAVTGLESVRMDKVTAESLSGLVTDDLTNPATGKTNVALLNKADGTYTFIKDENDNYAVPAPKPRQAFTVNFGAKTMEKALDETRTRIALASDAIQTLGNIEARYDRKYVTNIGRLGYSIAGLIDNFKKLDPKTRAGSFLGQAGAFYKDVQEAFLEYRHALTGAAGSDVEMEQIKAAFLDPKGEGGTVFEAAMERMKDIQQSHYEIELESLKWLEAGKSLSFVAMKKMNKIRAMLEAKGVNMGKLKRYKVPAFDPNDLGAAMQAYQKSKGVNN